MGLTEEQFIEMMNRIPVMEEKLDKLLFAFEKILESDKPIGIKKNNHFPPYEFDQDLADNQESIAIEIERKREEARRLKEEADALSKQFEL